MDFCSILHGLQIAEYSYTRQVYKFKLDEYGMSQSMSRVSKCIDNGVCEGFQGQFKDMLFI